MLTSIGFFSTGPGWGFNYVLGRSLQRSMQKLLSHLGVGFTELLNLTDIIS